MLESDLVVGVVVCVRVPEVAEDDELQRHQDDLPKLDDQLPRSLAGKRRKTSVTASLELRLIYRGSSVSLDVRNTRESPGSR